MSDNTNDNNPGFTIKLVEDSNRPFSSFVDNMRTLSNATDTVYSPIELRNQFNDFVNELRNAFTPLEMMEALEDIIDFRNDNQDEFDDILRKTIDNLLSSVVILLKDFDVEDFTLIHEIYMSEKYIRFVDTGGRYSVFPLDSIFSVSWNTYKSPFFNYGMGIESIIEEI